MREKTNALSNFKLPNIKKWKQPAATPNHIPTDTSDSIFRKRNELIANSNINPVKKSKQKKDGRNI